MVSDVFDGEVVDRPRLSTRAHAEAGRGSLSATVLDVLLAPLYAAGWVSFWVVLVVVSTVRLGWAAVRLGWADARALARSRGVAATGWPVREREGRDRRG